MTIAVVIKVHDGMVFASDSASSIMTAGAGVQPKIINVYNHANKIFNLRKGFPVAGITFGAGSIGQASISTMAKDLRRRFDGDDPDYKDWQLDPTNYTIKQVTEKAREFLFDEHYKPTFEKDDNPPTLGFWVGGFSAQSSQSELWSIEILNAKEAVVSERRTLDATGIDWSGEPEAIRRLIMGAGSKLPVVLKDMGIKDKDIPAAMAKINAELEVPLAMPPMPIQDAIDLGYFLVELTATFTRFKPGAHTVGGPIEIAAITKHEGFKWVRRKHYFATNLNPEANHD